MSTLSEVEAALRNHQDAHGTLSEADLVVAADQAFQEYDKAEGNDDHT
jgi:hypothetical protein